VEEKRAWELGGWSLNFRDLDRHLLLRIGYAVHLVSLLIEI
jgi:hypothetical protein